MRPFPAPLATALIFGLAACTTMPDPERSPISADGVIGRWSLKSVGSQPVSRGMTLDFRQGGLMVGTSRCNSMSGAYEVRPPAVIFPDPVIITVAGCGEDHPSNQREVETAERVLFSDPPSNWSLSSDRRRLFVHGLEDLLFERRR